MRDNEHRVRFLGFNTHVARTLIFAISAMFTGVAGALLAIANEATNYTIFAPRPRPTSCCRRSSAARARSSARRSARRS